MLVEIESKYCAKTVTDRAFIFLLFQLLDTLVKNCGRRFHLLIATRDFMCDLIRLVSPRDPTPQHVKDKVCYIPCYFTI